MIKPFLILQLRPEDVVAADELSAMLRYGGLQPADVHRVRVEKEALPGINFDDYSGVLVGGGPYNVGDREKSFKQIRFESEMFKLLDAVMDKDIPFLGACYGLGILAHYLGGTVSEERYSEDVGAVSITFNQEAREDPLLSGLPHTFRAFVGHKEACQELPVGVALLASSETCFAQMVRVKQNIYATQFHPELDAKGLELRINAYKYAGYFPPETAQKLIAKAMEENITVPLKIISRFVDRYKQPQEGLPNGQN